jgi:hypothetical protein
MRWQGGFERQSQATLPPLNVHGPGGTALGPTGRNLDKALNKSSEQDTNMVCYLTCKGSIVPVIDASAVSDTAVTDKVACRT